MDLSSKLSFEVLMEEWEALSNASGAEEDFVENSLWVEKLFCDTSRVLMHLELESERIAFKDMIQPLKELFGQSQFVTHCQEWPLGYPGDYQIVEQIMSGTNRSEPFGLGYLIEDYIIRLSSAAQQHRNKIESQATAILEIFHTVESPRILSLGPGPCHDIRKVQPFLVNRHFKIDLLDLDQRAWDHAKSFLKLPKGKVAFQQGNILKTHFPESAKYDLILAGGLFDYVSEPDLIPFLQKMYRLLSPQGRLFFTNVGEHDRWSPIRRHLLNWVLFERSEATLYKICAMASIPPSQTRIGMEATQTTYLVNIGE